MRKYLTTAQFAKTLGISTSTVINYCRQGKIRAEQSAITKYRKIPLEEVDRFCRKFGVKPAHGGRGGAGFAVVIACADDRQRDSLRRAVEKIKATGGVHVFDAGDALSACLLAGAHRPGVVVLDRSTRGADVTDVLRALRGSAVAGDAAVIVLDDSTGRTADRLRDAGATLILDRDTPAKDVRRAVKDLADGAL